MNNLGQVKLGQKPQLLPSKSLLDTAILGYEEGCIPTPPKKEFIFTEDESLMTTISTGFEPHDDKPVLPSPPETNCIIPPKLNPDSIIDEVETGFGECGKVEVECPKPLYKTPLYKENYFSEFKAETEKELARTNLGVYSKDAVHKLVEKMVTDGTTNFVTRKEVLTMLGDLDFVNSTLKSYANYSIPQNLFKL